MTADPPTSRPPSPQIAPVAQPPTARSRPPETQGSSGAAQPSASPASPEPALQPQNAEGGKPPEPVAKAKKRNLTVGPQSQMQLKTDQGRLRLQVPTPAETPLDWEELRQQLQHRLDAGKRFWTTRTPIDVIVGDRLLDQRQLQQLAASLATANLHLERVHTMRRQTAVAAVTAGYSVEQQANILPISQAPIGKFKVAPPAPAPEVTEPLYLQATLRSGNEIRHAGTVVVLGDLNPGSTVVAHGDIMVWGRLRGIAHAGAGGNQDCRIMALQMEPTQLRIADLVARAPSTLPTQYSPEVAHIAEGRIQITQAAEFAKNAAPPLAPLGNKA